MNRSYKSLNNYFEALRSASPKSFDDTRSIVEASSLVQQHKNLLSSMRLDFSLAAKRSFDFFMLPLMSAGISILLIIGTGGMLGEDATVLQTKAGATPITVIEKSQSITTSSSKRHTIANVSSKNEYPSIDQSTAPVPSSVETSLVSTVDPKTDFAAAGIRNESYFAEPYISSKDKERQYAGFSVGIESMLLQRSSSALIPSSSSPVRNGSLNLSYSFDAHQSIGLSIGEQCFEMEAIHPISVTVGVPATGGSKTVILNQKVLENNIHTFVGAFYSYSLHEIDILSYGHPFIQALFGTASKSILAKGMIGADFSFDSEIDYRLSVESAYLNYPIDNARQHSFNYALDLGIRFRW